MAESLPHIQKSAKPYPPKRKAACEECREQTDNEYFERYNGEPLRVCSSCAPKVRRREAKRRGEQLASKLIPKLFQPARIEHLSKSLQEKITALPDDRGLLLWGSQGVGKSYALAALMRDFLLRGKGVLRISYELLCLELRDTYKPGSMRTELGVVQPLIGAEKLFIEDVGTTVSGGKQETDFSLRTFLVLLDQRLECYRATFITTNKSVEELGKSFDPRIASRLQQACDVVHLTGKDRRADRA